MEKSLCVMQARNCGYQKADLRSVQGKSHPSLTFHLALAKFFSIWAQTPSLMFLSEAALPEILERVQMCLDLKGYMGLHGETVQPFPCEIRGLSSRPLWAGLSSGCLPTPTQGLRMGAARCEENRGQGNPDLSSHPPPALLTTHGRWPLPQ